MVKGTQIGPTFKMPLFFRNSRLKLAVFCVLLSAPDPKCALTPSDPKIRAGKFNIFALTRAVLRTLKNHIRPAS